MQTICIRGLSAKLYYVWAIATQISIINDRTLASVCYTVIDTCGVRVGLVLAYSIRMLTFYH